MKILDIYYKVPHQETDYYFTCTEKELDNIRIALTELANHMNIMSRESHKIGCKEYEIRELLKSLSINE